MKFTSDSRYNYLLGIDKKGKLNPPTLYNYIRGLLKEYPELRDSDKKLMAKLWHMQGIVNYHAMNIDDFINYAANPSSIFRARQLVQADNPNLGSSKEVQEAKDIKEESKGTFAYREELEQATQQTLI